MPVTFGIQSLSFIFVTLISSWKHENKYNKRELRTSASGRSKADRFLQISCVHPCHNYCVLMWACVCFLVFAHKVPLSSVFLNCCEGFCSLRQQQEERCCFCAENPCLKQGHRLLHGTGGKMFKAAMLQNSQQYTGDQDFCLRGQVHFCSLSCLFAYI